MSYESFMNRRPIVEVGSQKKIRGYWQGRLRVHLKWVGGFHLRTWMKARQSERKHEADY